MLKQALLSQCPELEIRENERLSAYTTFRIGGPARMILLPTTAEQLQIAIQTCREWGEIPAILGNGSNVLMPDEGVDGVIICTRNLSATMTQGTRLAAGAGCTLARLATVALQAGLTGLEFAHGIPGTLGGGTVMNAGAYGGELKDVITQVTCLDEVGNLVIKQSWELDMGYRHSCFMGSGLTIVAVEMQLQPGDPTVIKARMDELAARRRASQPLEYPSAGSTFKRPEGYFAGKLIQDSGLMGATVGGAQVSPKHAGFVINTGGATAADVLALIEKIQDTVFADSGVRLEPEVRLWGTGVQ